MTPFDLAQRFVGEVKELPGTGQNHPLIVWWLSLCQLGFGQPDEVPWCSAFINGICWQARAVRSKSAAARSWLGFGTSLTLAEAVPGWDIVILKRGTQSWQGHVGFFAGMVDGGHVRLLSGNVNNGVTIDEFPVADVIGVRRLAAA